ncbi:hypothetical protein ACXIUS_11960 [Bosea thiooxidans]|nr:hypothetical protein [Bosea sp. (in: a-proteobacteria)]
MDAHDGAGHAAQSHAIRPGKVLNRLAFAAFNWQCSARPLLRLSCERPFS